VAVVTKLLGKELLKNIQGLLSRKSQAKVIDEIVKNPELYGKKNAAQANKLVKDSVKAYDDKKSGSGTQFRLDEQNRLKKEAREKINKKNLAKQRVEERNNKKAPPAKGVDDSAKTSTDSSTPVSKSKKVNRVTRIKDAVKNNPKKVAGAAVVFLAGPALLLKKDKVKTSTTPINTKVKKDNSNKNKSQSSGGNTESTSEETMGKSIRAYKSKLNYSLADAYRDSKKKKKRIKTRPKDKVVKKSNTNKKSTNVKTTDYSKKKKYDPSFLGVREK